MHLKYFNNVRLEVIPVRGHFIVSDRPDYTLPLLSGFLSTPAGNRRKATAMSAVKYWPYLIPSPLLLVGASLLVASIPW